MPSPQWDTVKLNAIPAGFHKLANIRVAVTGRVFQHIGTIISPETCQGLLLGKVMQPRKGKQFAGTFIPPGFVENIVITKSSGDERVQAVD